MNETHEHRIKRMRMRSMRRGIKEMDLILTVWSATNLAALPPEQLDLYDALLHENDQDLYQWVTGQVPPPQRFGALIGEIARTFQKQDESGLT